MYTKVLVPLHGSELAECVLPHVELITGGCGVKEVVFLRVVEAMRWAVAPPFGVDELSVGLPEKEVTLIDAENQAAAKKYLKQLVARTKYSGVTVNSEVIMGKAAESIADYVTRNGIELIIIATHGRSGVSRWVMGSVADRVLRSACVPVLMIRAPGCVEGV